MSSHPSPASPQRIAVFASGSGSNAEALVRHFNDGPASETGHVVLIVCNKAEAGVLARAQALGVPALLTPRNGYDDDGAALLTLLKRFELDVIALAGYLRKVPTAVVQAYRGRLLNIHPSLLPRHGGKNMYGTRVHQAVLQAGDAESGISIHHVTEEYDQGALLKQVKLPVQPHWSAHDLQAAIHQLEHAHYPAAVEALCHQLQNSTS